MRDLVLLHGWGTTPRVWDGVGRDLSASFRIHNLPLPGYGPEGGEAAAGREAMGATRTLDRWSDHCLARAPDGALWLGWSLGALVALNAALRRAGAVSGLVLVSATPKFVREPGWEAGIERDVLRGFQAGIRNNRDEILKRFVMLQAGDSDNARRLARTMGAYLAVDGVGDETLLAGLKILEEIDLRSRLNDISIPVCVIHGTGDRVVPVEAGAFLARHVPAGDLVRLDTGHAPFMTRPEAFVEAVRSWT